MDCYYWICWEWINNIGKYIESDVFTEHPFKAIARKRKKSKGIFVILNYKEITKEEYEMFNLEFEDM